MRNDDNFGVRLEFRSEGATSSAMSGTVVFPQESYGESRGVQNCLFFLLREVKPRCEYSKVGQMLFNCVFCLALHSRVFRDAVMIRQKQQLESKRVRTPTGWGAIRRLVGVFSHCNAGGELRELLHDFISEQFHSLAVTDFFIPVDNFFASSANIISRNSFASWLPWLTCSMSLRFASSGIIFLATGFS
jgi:hypothetical protein